MKTPTTSLAQAVRDSFPFGDVKSLGAAGLLAFAKHAGKWAKVRDLCEWAIVWKLLTDVIICLNEFRNRHAGVAVDCPFVLG